MMQKTTIPGLPDMNEDSPAWQAQSQELLREYNRCLVEGHGCMARREVKKKDTVDLRPILDLKGLAGWRAPNPGIEAADIWYMQSDYWYSFIPCFEEGVYHVNSGRYLYWRIEDLDLEKHRLQAFVQDYIYYDSGSGWQPGVYGSIEAQFGDPKEQCPGMMPEGLYAVMPGAICDYVGLYRLIDLKGELRWTDAQIREWDRLVMKYAKDTKKELARRGQKSNLDNLAMMFMGYTIKTNRILAEHRHAKKSRPASKSEHEAYLAEKQAYEESAVQAQAAAGAPAAGPVKPKERRVHTIGPIEVTSKERPKPGKRAAANYKKASWKTRGHIRTLKSGRKVRVKESVHRRKALEGTPGAAAAPAETTPTTLRITSAHPLRKKEDDGREE